MNASKMLLDIAEQLRPVITKVLPAGLLSSLKAKVVRHAGEGVKKGGLIPYVPGYYDAGVNIIANVRGDTGLGQAARALTATIRETGLPFTVKEFFVPPCGSRNNHEFDAYLSDELPYGINLIHVNASELPIAYLHLGADTWNRRYNIGYWVWELEEFPQEWMSSFSLVDELWTPSEFVSRTLRKYTEKPVYTIPHYVSAPTEERYDRAYFGLPKEQFLFLMVYASGSVMERKNPIGVIQAFKAAFGRDDKQVGLVIKMSGEELSGSDKERLESYLAEYDNIYVMTGNYRKTEVNSLLAAVDVFVSLHRAEGFGLVMAEAMMVGTPVIATNWSANTEFMNSDVACMVDYKMTEVPQNTPPFPKGSQWADANVSQAADYMKKLYQDKDFYDSLAVRAKAYIEKKLSLQEIGKLAKDRICEILEEAK